MKMMLLLIFLILLVVNLQTTYIFGHILPDCVEIQHQLVSLCVTSCISLVSLGYLILLMVAINED